MSVYVDKLLDKTYLNRYILTMPQIPKKIAVFFFKSDTGKMPVRDWLLGLPAGDRRIIGEDIKTVEFGWPVGMPVSGLLATNCMKFVRS